MLRELHITDLGVIHDLDVHLHPGLNVLTGETGAGKTMVTVGLALATGARASAQLVRTGATTARVQARFDAPEGTEDLAEDGEMILARSVAADGKSAARVSGQLTTVATLQGFGERLVEVHGQHQSLRLLDVGTQTAFLDRFAGDAHVVAVAAYRETWEALRRARRRLQELEAAGRDRERELDLLAYQVREIEELSPRAGESEELGAEAARLGDVERLQGSADAAIESLVADDAANDLLARVAGALESIASTDPVAGGLAERAQALAAEAGELARDVRAYRGSLAADPGRLDEVRSRLATLRGLQRKYGATDADVVAFGRDAAARLLALQSVDRDADAVRGEVTELAADLETRGAAVGRGRAAAAGRLAAALTAELAELGMATSAVEVSFEQLAEPGPTGFERAELLLSPGPGQAPLPVGKVASGGELSRLMLACRSVLADLDDVPTLVFDEVDAGIGGQAGLAVGRRLAALAATRQVLVVTHLPQIACFADRHFRVRKEDGVASVDALDDADRVRELSRMLAGLEESTHAVSHAQELLAEAARTRAEV